MMPHIKTDLHCHTIASGHALSTLDELARTAYELGLELIAVTDHGPTMEGAPHEGYFTMAERVPKRINGVTVLMGCEANILSPEGELDLPSDLLRAQDIVVAGLHRRTPYPSIENSDLNTRALTSAMQNSDVHIIAHPYRSDARVDVGRVAEAAAESGTLLEVNLSTIAPTLLAGVGNETVLAETRHMLHVLARNGGQCVLSSDAHHIWELGISDEMAARIVEVLEISSDLVANLDIRSLSKYINIPPTPPGTVTVPS